MYTARSGNRARYCWKFDNVLLDLEQAFDLMRII